MDPITGVVDPRLVEEDKVTAICMTGVGRSQILTGAILGLMREHFSSEKNIVHPEIKGVLWSRIDAPGSLVTAPDAGVYIEPVWAWEPRFTEKRPALLVKKNSTYVHNYLLANKRHGGYGVDIGTQHEVEIRGSYTVFCVARNAVTAEILGTEVLFKLVEFRSVITVDLNLNRFEPMELGAASKLKESKEHWVCPVSVATAFRHAWSMHDNAPVLKGVHLTTQ